MNTLINNIADQLTDENNTKLFFIMDMSQVEECADNGQYEDAMYELDGVLEYIPSIHEPALLSLRTELAAA